MRPPQVKHEAPPVRSLPTGGADLASLGNRGRKKRPGPCIGFAMGDELIEQEGRPLGVSQGIL